MDQRYFLKASFSPWTEVSREEWIKAEQAAGFYPKGGGNYPATAGFSNGLVQGAVVSNNASPESYNWEPELAEALRKKSPVAS